MPLLLLVLRIGATGRDVFLFRGDPNRQSVSCWGPTPVSAIYFVRPVSLEPLLKSRNGLKVGFRRPGFHHDGLSLPALDDTVSELGQVFFWLEFVNRYHAGFRPCLYKRNDGKASHLHLVALCSLSYGRLSAHRRYDSAGCELWELREFSAHNEKSGRTLPPLR